MRRLAPTAGCGPRRPISNRQRLTGGFARTRLLWAVPGRCVWRMSVVVPASAGVSSPPADAAAAGPRSAPQPQARVGGAIAPDLGTTQVFAQPTAAAHQLALSAAGRL